MILTFIPSDEFQNLGAKVYLFGSALKGDVNIRDVDLLVVYDEKTDIISVKKSLELVKKIVPMDITYMHTSEEVEFCFIQNQRAVPIGEVWHNNSLQSDENRYADLGGYAQVSGVAVDEIIQSAPGPEAGF